MSYSGLIPLIAGVVPAERIPVLLAVLRDPQQFLSPAGIRSLSAASSLYMPGEAGDGVNSNWRGPVWVSINYLLVDDLSDLDAPLADDLRSRLVANVEADWQKAGRLHEYFDGDTRCRPGRRLGRGLDCPDRQPDSGGLARVAALGRDVDAENAPALRGQVQLASLRSGQTTRCPCRRCRHASRRGHRRPARRPHRAPRHCPSSSRRRGICRQGQVWPCRGRRSRQSPCSCRRRGRRWPPAGSGQSRSQPVGGWKQAAPSMMFQP